jgi:hypothetical protein
MTPGTDARRAIRGRNHPTRERNAARREHMRQAQHVTHGPAAPFEFDPAIGQCRCACCVHGRSYHERRGGARSGAA